MKKPCYIHGQIAVINHKNDTVELRCLTCGAALPWFGYSVKEYREARRAIRKSE